MLNREQVKPIKRPLLACSALGTFITTLIMAKIQHSFDMASQYSTLSLFTKQLSYISTVAT